MLVADGSMHFPFHFYTISRWKIFGIQWNIYESIYRCSRYLSFIWFFGVFFLCVCSPLLLEFIRRIRSIDHFIYCMVYMGDCVGRGMHWMLVAYMHIVLEASCIVGASSIEIDCESKQIRLKTSEWKWKLFGDCQWFISRLITTQTEKTNNSIEFILPTRHTGCYYSSK